MPPTSFVQKFASEMTMGISNRSEKQVRYGKTWNVFGPPKSVLISLCIVVSIVNFPH
jgi:hypothetical protein